MNQTSRADQGDEDAVILGVIVGAVLVIGAAYVHDNLIGRPAAQQVVDWDKVTGLFSRRTK